MFMHTDNMGCCKMLLIYSTLVTKSSKMCSFCYWGSSNYFINITMGMGTKHVGMGWRWDVTSSPCHSLQYMQNYSAMKHSIRLFQRTFSSVAILSYCEGTCCQVIKLSKFGCYGPTLQGKWTPTLGPIFKITLAS